MKRKLVITTTTSIESLIFSLRGEKIMLDVDLARLYGVPTKALNRAVKRNTSRFPGDFMFRLAKDEVESIRCQTGTGSQKHRDPRYLPYAFTEHGAIMAAIVTVLQRMMEILDPPPQPDPPRKQIGFQLKERKARYRVTA